MVNAYCAIAKLETFSTSNFTFSVFKDHKPLKTKRVNSKEKIYTPKFRLLSLLTREINSFAGWCWKHVRTAQQFTIEWPTGPGWRGSSTSAEVGNLRIPIESLPSLYIRNAKLLYWASDTLLYGYWSSLYAPNFRLYDDCCWSLAFIQEWPPRGGGRDSREPTTPGGRL